MTTDVPFNPKKVIEDISVPGMVIKNAGAAKVDDTVIRVRRFTVGLDDGEDQTMLFEALLNREDVHFIDYHKYTFQNNFHVVITYSEPRIRE